VATVATNSPIHPAAAGAKAVETAQVTSGLSVDEAKARVAEFLESSPLYSPLHLKLKDEVSAGDLTPGAISLHCRKCADQATTTWTPGSDKGLRYENITFTCVRCKSTEIRFWLRIEPHPWRRAGGGSTETANSAHTMRKVGQWPPWHDRISADIEHALEQNGEQLDLYKKASDCMRFGYGVGALAYFRRVVEDTADTILEIIRDTAQAEGDEKAAAAADDARQGKDVESKLKMAAASVRNLPRPGGVNPLQRLYDDYSIGIHRKSDEDSLATAVDMKSVFDFSIKILAAHAREAKAFAEQLKKK
jgi:hypothetical protein